MLTIRRVPTLVSINQELEQAGCGLDCLGMCCIPGAKLPLYLFARRYGPTQRNFNFVHCRSAATGGDEPSHSSTFLDTIILAQVIGAIFSDLKTLQGSFYKTSTAHADLILFAILYAWQWEDRMSRGLFRYDVTTCQTKVLSGSYGFIAQLNEGRHLKKRPTEFRVDQVLQPFDSNKFNFTKVGQQEVLFRFEESGDHQSAYYERADILSSPNVVAINVSPIEYGHILFIPNVLDCIPQKITEDTFVLALHLAAEADNPYFRLGYNSLGAFATINHLHFQAYYLAAPFPVERAPSVRLPTLAQGNKMSLKISELSQYPVKGLVFEMGQSYEELSRAVAKTCIELQELNFPFNILITDRGTRVFLFPQCFAERQARCEVDQWILDTQVNPAVWEISGHIVLKRKTDYDTATEDYVWKLLAEVSLSEEAFQEVKTICMRAVAGMNGLLFPRSLELVSNIVRPAGAHDLALLAHKDNGGIGVLKHGMRVLPAARPYGDITIA